jgi:hypothetical protein
MLSNPSTSGTSIALLAGAECHSKTEKP